MKIRIYPRIRYFLSEELSKEFIPKKLTDKDWESYLNIFKDYKLSIITNREYEKRYLALEEKLGQTWVWDKFNNITMDSLEKHLKYWFTPPNPRANSAIEFMKVCEEYIEGEVDNWWVEKLSDSYDFQIFKKEKWTNGIKNYDKE